MESRLLSDKREFQHMRNIAVLLFAAGLSSAQIPNPGYGSAPPAETFSSRGLVDRAQGDLRRAANLEHHRHRDQEVSHFFENAQRDLSDFNRQMTDGYFDKGKLDTAIDELRNAVEHTAPDRDTRGALQNDLLDLQQMSALHSDH